jgi:hypothetical protein
VESVSVDPNALNLVGLRDSLIRTFDPKQCVGTPLPESYRACLLQASSLQALEACKPPRSPFVKHAQRRLQGQWTVSNVDGSKSSQLSYLLRASLQRCRLELDNQKIAFDCLEDGGVDVLGVEAQDTDKAVLLLPLEKSRVPKRVVFGESEDSFTMPDFAPGVELTFRRSVFHSLLKP